MADMFKIPVTDLQAISTKIVGKDYPEAGRDMNQLGILITRHTPFGYLRADNLDSVYGIDLAGIVNRLNGGGYVPYR